MNILVTLMIVSLLIVTAKNQISPLYNIYSNFLPKIVKDEIDYTCKMLADITPVDVVYSFILAFLTEQLSYNLIGIFVNIQPFGTISTLLSIILVVIIYSIAFATKDLTYYKTNYPHYFIVSMMFLFITLSLNILLTFIYVIIFVALITGFMWCILLTHDKEHMVRKEELGISPINKRAKECIDKVVKGTPLYKNKFDQTVEKLLNLMKSPGGVFSNDYIDK